MLPISVTNELKVWKLVIEKVESSLSAYKTSYEEDVEILKKDDADKGLTNQERNCVLLKKGEKEILMFLKDTAEAFIKMCSMSEKEAQ